MGVACAACFEELACVFASSGALNPHLLKDTDINDKYDVCFVTSIGFVSTAFGEYASRMLRSDAAGGSTPKGRPPSRRC